MTDAARRLPAFEGYVRDRQRGLLQTAWLLTGDWQLAEDLVQSALLTVAPRWAGIEHPEAADSYVRRVMMRTFLASQRRRWRSETPTDVLPELPVGVDALAQVDSRRDLVAAMRLLAPRQRAVVVLRHIADLSEAETAAALGCSVGTVKSHNARALTALAAALTPTEEVRP